MLKRTIRCVIAVLMMSVAYAADEITKPSPLAKHPDTTGWQDVFALTLSNAMKPKEVWSIANGELGASKDEACA